MSKLIPGNQKHMTIDNRIIIEKELDKRTSLRGIALQLGKDPITIATVVQNDYSNLFISSPASKANLASGWELETKHLTL